MMKGKVWTMIQYDDASNGSLATQQSIGVKIVTQQLQVWIDDMNANNSRYSTCYIGTAFCLPR